MPFWIGYWGPPWTGWGWIFPLIGLLIMFVMAIICIRMMGGVMSGGCMTGHVSHSADEVEALRREVRELRDEIRNFRDRS